MKNYFLISGVLLVITIVVSGCRPKNDPDPGTTIISGNIQHPSCDKIYFYSYADSIGFYMGNLSALDSAIIGQNGDFSISPNLSKPQSFSLLCGDKDLVANLFICQGDNIKINFLGRNNTPQVVPAGKASKFNIYLLKFQDMFYRNPEIKQEYYIASNYMEIDQFATYITRRKQSMVDFYNTFFGKDNLKKEHADFALYTIDYEIASDRLMYLWKKRMKGEPVTADSAYFNFTASEFLENPDAFITPSYIRFLNLYLKDFYERMVERGELPADKSGTLIPPVEKYRLAFRLFNEPFREAVLYNLLLSDMNDVSDKVIASHHANPGLDSLIAAFKRKYSLN